MSDLQDSRLGRRVTVETTDHRSRSGWLVRNDERGVVIDTGKNRIELKPTSVVRIHTTD